MQCNVRRDDSNNIHIASLLCLFYGRVGRHIVFPLASVRLSVHLSVTKSCPLYYLKTVRDISTKLHTLVKHIQMTCCAQEPELCFGFMSYVPLIICDDISCPLCNLITDSIVTRTLIICDAISCPLYNLATSRGISTKLHTFLKHIQVMCHAQEPLLCFGYFGVI